MSVICFINNGCRNTVTVETIVLILKIPISFLYLSNSFKKYKKAMDLLKSCDEELKNVEEKVSKIVSSNGELENFEVEE